jgi:hypothetical protein
MFNQQPQQFQSFNNFQQAPVQQMMQQPAQLPFNPQAPQYQAIQITVNNLPVNLMPLQNAVNPKLHPYLPGIAAACIDAIQSRAAQNPLRMFLFNQMASTNFTSQNFLVLLKVVCDISELYAVNGMAIEQAINSAVDLSVQFAAFNNLQAFPGLQNYIDQNMVNNLQQLSQKQQMLTQQVMQYQQQRNNQMAQNNFNQVQQTPASWNNTSTGLFTTGQTVQQPASNMVDSWASNDNSQQPWAQGAQDWRNPEPALAVKHNPTPAFSFATVEPAAQKVEPVVNTPQYEKMYHHDGQVMVKKGDPGVVWRPSNRWFHDPARTKTHDVYYIVHTDGSLEPILKKLTKEELMEREKHYGPLGYRPTAAKAWDSVLIHDIEKREAYVKNLMEHGTIMSDAKPNRSKTTLKEDEIVKDDTSLIITASEDAFIQADIAMTVSDTPEKPCSAYMKNAMRVSHIVSETEADALVDHLKDSVSLEQCAGKLKVENYTIKSVTNDRVKRAQQIVHGKLNRLLTKSVNHYLKYKLGLPALQIDSFEEDGGGLLAYIEEKYPSQYVQALRKDQKYIIDCVLSKTTDGLQDSELNEAVKEQELPDMDMRDFQTVFLYRKERYLAVNLFCAELGMTIPDNTVECVLPEYSPLMYSLCNAVVGRDNEEIDTEVYTHYIKTLDDVIYEVSRSAITPTVYLVGTVK